MRVFPSGIERAIVDTRQAKPHALFSEAFPDLVDFFGSSHLFLALAFGFHIGIVHCDSLHARVSRPGRMCIKQDTAWKAVIDSISQNLHKTYRVVRNWIGPSRDIRDSNAKCANCGRICPIKNLTIAGNRRGRDLEFGQLAGKEQVRGEFHHEFAKLSAGYLSFYSLAERPAPA